MTQIQDYHCFRQDRSDRVGGGVAIWSHRSLRPSRFILERKPLCLEAVAPRLLTGLVVICVYIPPLPSIRSRDEILNFLTDSVDRIQSSCPNIEAIVCGDFNRFCVVDLCAACGLSNMFSDATYNASQLDYILMTAGLAKRYQVTATAPIDSSKVPHMPVMASPRNIHSL